MNLVIDANEMTVVCVRPQPVRVAGPVVMLKRRCPAVTRGEEDGYENDFEDETGGAPPTGNAVWAEAARTDILIPKTSMSGFVGSFWMILEYL